MIESLQQAIAPVNNALDKEIWAKLNDKTKPPGSLGRLEDLAFQIARVQQSLTPSLKKPVVVVFAGDHGIAASGLINPFPQEVTYQMVMNFVNAGAAINAMSRVAAMQITVVDAGVNHTFDPGLPLVHAKMGQGTKDYRHEPAMSLETCQQAVQKGADIVSDMVEKGSNVIGFGEMGIGNTSSASLIMSSLCDLPLSECVGKGTGAIGGLFEQKLRTLQEVQQFHNLPAGTAPDRILATFGGFEIAEMVGGMLAAASKRCLILVDGFISSAAFMIAKALQPLVQDYAIFTHQSEERGHVKALSY
ncbi:MAG: nicotinate-nucleotide--dimethylbenzimidazole phosphoribosyltransferase, partial [Bacteroidota bacterium]